MLIFMVILLIICVLSLIAAINGWTEIKITKDKK
jgi:hypothetical protein